MIRPAPKIRALKINCASGCLPKTRRPVRLNEAAVEGNDPAVRTAEKLVAACRYNVEFLNAHLKKFKPYLELPSLVDNALYLAYSIRVRDSAPCDPLWLRRKLALAGIETSPAFSFASGSEQKYTGPAIDRVVGARARSSLDERAFCLGCHQYLGIVDLKHVIDTFESIFHELETGGRFGSEGQNSGEVN